MDYTFDPIYRLISASGREHLGQTKGRPDAPTAPSAFNELQTRLLAPGDGNAMGRYVEQYSYDEVGNFISMQHSGSSPQSPGWTQRYNYQEVSALEPSKVSNRISSTTVGAASQQFAYDEHGNMTKMPQLSLMQWDYKDQLQATAMQNVNSGTPESTFYVYDDSGRRVRKVTERAAEPGQSPTRMTERIYIGDLFETYREYAAPPSTTVVSTAPPTSPAVVLERTSLHIIDDKDPVCMVETRVVGTDPAPAQLIRYSHGNHLGSVSLELSDSAQIISYEEYFPYGATSFQSVRSQTDVPKRYRYTRKERDEENGLYYHGARYYAC